MSIERRVHTLEQRLPPRRQVGAITRLYTPTDPTALLFVRVVLLRFTGDPPFTDADTQALDARIAAKYGPHFVGSFA